MSQLKKLAGDTAIYGASSIIGRMLNYLLVPYYTGVFVPEEYGVVTEFYTIAAFCAVLYVYGLETAYFRFASKEESNKKEIYNSAVTSILVTSIIFSATLYIFSSQIAEILEYPGKAHYVQWFSGIFFIDALVAIPFAKLRLERKAKLFAAAKLTNILINIGLNLFFISFCRQVYLGQILPDLKPLIEYVYKPEFGIEYIFLSNLIANAALILILWKQFLQLRLRINWAIFKPMFKYAYPLLFTGLAYVTNEMLSRLALKYWLPEDLYPGYSNLDILGIFGAVYKLSIFMTLGIQAFRYAAEPFFFSQGDNKKSPELFARVMLWFIIFGCFVLLSISINLDWLQYLLRGEDYRKGIGVVPILLLANLFLGIYFNLSVWYKLTDRTYFGTWITSAAAIITIVLNYVLIPIYGYYGSAAATLIVYVSMSAASYLIGRKYYPLPYQVIKSMSYIVGTCLLTFLVLQLEIENRFISTAFHFIIMILFVLAVVLLEKKSLPAKRT